MGYWREKAWRAIDEVIAQAKLEGKDLKEIKKAIDASYPFGERKNFPYKVWLDERRKAFYDLGILEKKPDKLGRKTRKPPVKVDHVVEGQLSLW